MSNTKKEILEDTYRLLFVKLGKEINMHEKLKTDSPDKETNVMWRRQGVIATSRVGQSFPEDGRSGCTRRQCICWCATELSRGRRTNSFSRLRNRNLRKETQEIPFSSFKVQFTSNISISPSLSHYFDQMGPSRGLWAQKQHAWDPGWAASLNFPNLHKTSKHKVLHGIRTLRHQIWFLDHPPLKRPSSSGKITQVVPYPPHSPWDGGCPIH